MYRNRLSSPRRDHAITVRFMKENRIMAVQSMNVTHLKAVVSVAEMCKQLSMSRSQFYFHVKRGTFHAPLYLPNKRPYYTASMVEDNLKARATGITVAGEYVIFYERTTSNAKQDYSSLIEGLRLLGLNGITNEQIDGALAKCYPKGIVGLDESSVLRVVFKYLKSSGTG